jgi:uncharacterized protein
MPFWRRRADDDARLRLFFATDLHGSDVCFRKFLAAARVYGVDALVLGGDLTGKSVLPLVRDGDGFRIGLDPRGEVLTSEESLADYEKRAADWGGYPKRLDRADAERIAQDDEVLKALLHSEAAARAARWRTLDEERLAGSDVRCFVSGGNDDPPDVLAAIAHGTNGADASPVVFCDESIAPLPNGVELISIGHSNETPWHTPRELTEEALSARIEALLRDAERPEQAVFNFHVPPRASGLDRCPELDVSTDPPTPVRIGGELVFTNAGSTAVRDALERHQPPVSLHGHIHESRAAARIGGTLALNPGSDYHGGMLLGVLVTVARDAVHHRFTAG